MTSTWTSTFLHRADATCIGNRALSYLFKHIVPMTFLDAMHNLVLLLLKSLLNRCHTHVMK